MPIYVASDGKMVLFDTKKAKEEPEAKKIIEELRNERKEDTTETARIAKIREELLEKNLRVNEMHKTKRSVIQQMTSLYNRHLRKK